MLGLGSKNWNRLVYFLRNAPLAILTSSLPGFVNYVIIVYLSYRMTPADVGQYRLMMSYLALTGLLSLQEGGKILIRAHVQGQPDGTATVFFARAYAAAAGLIVILGVSLGSDVLGLETVPADLVAVAAFAALLYPLDLFSAYLQAERRFATLALWTALKFLLALVVFAVLIAAGASVKTATYAQIATMLAFHAGLFVLWLGDDIWSNRHLASPWRLFRRHEVRETIVLSAANLLPSTLEHVDKLAIGYFFGLDALGIYTLGFSTGRFIYNALKPAFYIYFRHYVDRLPAVRLLWAAMIVFTIFGLALSGAFLWGVAVLPFLAKFKGTEIVTVILFSTYGVAMVDAIYTQSYGINKHAKTIHLFWVNLIMSLICLGMFAVSGYFSPLVAMVICACHYPVRHLGTVVALSITKRLTELRDVARP